LSWRGKYYKMEGKDIRDIIIVGAVVYGVTRVAKIFDNEAPTIPSAYTPNPAATIDISRANVIAKNIKNGLGNVYNDIQAIDKAMWALQNKFDVELLYYAFGTNDSLDLKAKGDLFSVLDSIRYQTCYPCSDVNFQSIKAHLYEYGGNLKNY
jgi:hypothetical protein